MGWPGRIMGGRARRARRAVSLPALALLAALSTAGLTACSSLHSTDGGSNSHTSTCVTVGATRKMTFVSSGGGVTVPAATIFGISLDTPYGLVAEPATSALLPWATPRLTQDTAGLRPVPTCAGTTFPQAATGTISRWFFRAAHRGTSRLVVPISDAWRDAYETSLCGHNQLITCAHPHPVRVTVHVT